jgi:signal transduction histidine kinase
MAHSDLRHRYERIIEISQQLNTTFDIHDILKRIVDAAGELVDVEGCSIMLYDETIGQLHFAAGSNLEQTQYDSLVVPLEGSIAGWIFTHGEARVIEDVRESGEHYRGIDQRIAFQTRNLLGVPMRARSRVIGVLQAVNTRSGAPFTDEDIVTMRTLASQASIALENARLFQQNDFIAEMVHELRTPLMALKASSALLDRPELTESKRTTIRMTIRSETERLIRLTDDFMDIAQLESGRARMAMEPFHVPTLLAEAAEVVRAQADARQLRMDWRSDDCYALGDAAKVKQVLLNLLSNAIKYNRADGSIRMQAMLVDSGPLDRVHFLVQDTGLGIPPEFQTQVFERFRRLPGSADTQTGSGLGLAISRAIVEAHGGRIWIDSVQGIGSSFHFTLRRGELPG